MDSNGFGLGTAIVNMIIFAISLWLMYYTYIKCYRLALPDKDHQFYSLKFQKCVAFFIFNAVALYVNWRIFFDLHLNWPQDLVFLRYVDRAVVLIYSFYKILDITRYYPSAYDRKIIT